ncbi:hypothetical protein QCA50_013610 [Cerrena zonata]|uniref:Methyltransferase-domain-containing protein n=1 Tax=Cerrena zonata TaxID=2478898 RepID=A0AAW0FNT1_9APHY
MFFYISFLRPPPLQASPSSPLIITPQIANDLRTELYAGEQDIFYGWTSITSNSSSSSAGIPTITKSRKLTTWRQDSAYKEIKVPLPLGIREGQSYKLVLTAYDQGHPHIINLATLSCGPRPLPVLSMPILFTSRGYSSAKQEQVERIYRLTTPQRGQLFLKIKEQTSFDLDKKVWDSGIGLSSWIDFVSTQKEELLSPPEKEFRERFLQKGICNVIELGAGTGIVSLTLGAIRSEQAGNSGQLLTTDLDSAMPLLEHNISNNEHLFVGDRPQALVLDWDEESLPSEVTAIQDGFDLVIMADVTYNTASFPSLVRTLQNLVHNSSGKARSPLLLLGYKERDPAERTLWEMAETVGITFEHIGEREGAGGAPVEVWLGRVKGV